MIYSYLKSIPYSHSGVVVVLVHGRWPLAWHGLLQSDGELLENKNPNQPLLGPKSHAMTASHLTRRMTLCNAPSSSAAASQWRFPASPTHAPWGAQCKVTKCAACEAHRREAPHRCTRAPHTHSLLCPLVTLLRLKL